MNDEFQARPVGGRPTRADTGGRAYLDLRNRARREGRSTQELLVLYVLERFLARLAVSPYADQFVLKGGLLLAVLDVRRPTADAESLRVASRTTKTSSYAVSSRSPVSTSIRTTASSLPPRH